MRAAAVDPADVPTTTSASRASHPISSARAVSTPAWNAVPVSPPAPSTRPTRGMSAGVHRHGVTVALQLLSPSISQNPA
jgi:hypothetical protein